MTIHDITRLIVLLTVKTAAQKKLLRGGFVIGGKKTLYKTDVICNNLCNSSGWPENRFQNRR